MVKCCTAWSTSNRQQVYVRQPPEPPDGTNKSRTDVELNSFLPSATRIWNALSEDVVASPLLPAFQSAVQGWLKAR
jgi:hypothetical protein